VPSANGHPIVDPSNVAVTVELAEQTARLSAILAELRSEVPQLAVTDAVPQEMVLEHWPVTGLKRVLVRRTGNGTGTTGITVPTTGTLLLPPNEGRVGMNWVNSGANAIAICLSDAARAGFPALWLGPNGGSWDGRFGAVTWCGNVFAVAITGSSTIIGGEF
jgi:hypothetical protein